MSYSLILMILLVVLLILIYLVRKNKTVKLDNKINSFVVYRRNSKKTKAMLFFTTIGRGKFVAIICMILFLISKKEDSFPLIASISSIMSIPVSSLLKRMINRERPSNPFLINEKDKSFPSAHAFTAATLYGSILLNFSPLNTYIHLISGVTCLVFIFFIGFSRLYFGVHYFTDILGGWILVFLLSIFVTILV